MRQLIISRDPSSIPTYATRLTTGGYVGRLAADADTTCAIPAGARYALISAEDSYFISESVITFPTESAGFSAQNAELNKDVIFIDGETELHFKARTAIDMSISFYA